MSFNLSQFAQPKSKIEVFFDRYQYLLSIAATFIFFSEIYTYALDAGILPVNALTWIGIFGVLSLPFIKKIKTMPRPLVIAMGVYLAVSIVSVATVSADAASIEELRKRILSVFFICMMYIIYQQKSLTQVKYALLAVVLLSIVNNFYELLNPGAFGLVNSGRPSGFYLNPNKTACALVLGMLFSIDIIKKPYRWLYILAVGIGLLLTFTRGGIIGWIVCVAILIASRMVSDKRRTVLLPMLVLCTFLVIANPLKLLGGYFEGGMDSSYSNVVSRLEQFQTPSLEDESARDRSSVAKYAWKMFGDRPFWGHGLSSTNKWTVADISTHNMYLYYMVDHGVIGLIFLPGAVFAVVYRNRGEDKIIILCFIIFIGLWGLFSHNVLDEKYILLPFALLAAMNTNQSWYRKYAIGKFQLALPPARAQFLLPPARTQKLLTPPVYVAPSRKRLVLPPPREQKALPPSRE
jgi:formate/nitrite transporter FocA (FNT family)